MLCRKLLASHGASRGTTRRKDDMVRRIRQLLSSRDWTVVGAWQW